MKKTLLRSATLFFFFGGILCFVMYKAGVIDPGMTEIQSSHNGGTLNNTTEKNAGISDSMFTIMSSSKSMVLSEKRAQMDTSDSLQQDTMLHLPTTIMSSSKSAIIFQFPDADSVQTIPSEPDEDN